VVNAFRRYLVDNKVQIKTGTGVNKILVEKGCITGVLAGIKSYPAAAVILTPAVRLIRDRVHRRRLPAGCGNRTYFNQIAPSLVPLVVHEIERAKSMQGVSLHNVRLTAFQCAADDVDIAKMPTKTPRGIPGKRRKRR